MKNFKTEVSWAGLEKIMDPDPVNIKPDPKPCVHELMSSTKISQSVLDSEKDMCTNSIITCNEGE